MSLFCRAFKSLQKDVCSWCKINYQKTFQWCEEAALSIEGSLLIDADFILFNTVRYKSIQKERLSNLQYNVLCREFSTTMKTTPTKKKTFKTFIALKRLLHFRWYCCNETTIPISSYENKLSLSYLLIINAWWNKKIFSIKNKIFSLWLLYW